jgi:hypothetical protein
LKPSYCSFPSSFATEALFEVVVVSGDLLLPARVQASFLLAPAACKLELLHGPISSIELPMP